MKFSNLFTYNTEYCSVGQELYSVDQNKFILPSSKEFHENVYWSEVYSDIIEFQRDKYNLMYTS